jgi:hypothetical protein
MAYTIKMSLMSDIGSPTFRRNVLSPPSVSKSKLSKQIKRIVTTVSETLQIDGVYADLHLLYDLI